ncbi:hypothetical protein PR048_026482 [Dryococelus australis]|uniref:DUF5641 domain-containing protein n=1 Tax=Dryococelus australis TaxID=614101 RepID=A0ABQ9GLF7_9NEOP|nr:hypothetical protein PR048_026482 [Dryococelus australis]
MLKEIILTEGRGAEAVTYIIVVLSEDAQKAVEEETSASTSIIPEQKTVSFGNFVVTSPLELLLEMCSKLNKLIRVTAYLIEAILHSRPLSPLSLESNDLSMLTPSYFLTLEPLVTVPEQNLEDVQLNIFQSWQLVEKFQQDVWKCRHQNHHHTLQQHPKWQEENQPLYPQQFVLAKEDWFPPLQWRLRRIVELIPGLDKVPNVLAIPHTQFSVGTEITLRLMKREKGSLIATPAAEFGTHPSGRLLSVSETAADAVYSKLLLATSAEVVPIIDRERKELEIQLSEEKDSPELCFIEQALELLKQREDVTLRNNQSHQHLMKNISALPMPEDSGTHQSTSISVQKTPWTGEVKLFLISSGLILVLVAAIRQLRHLLVPVTPKILRDLFQAPTYLSHKVHLWLAEYLNQSDHAPTQPQLNVTTVGDQTVPIQGFTGFSALTTNNGITIPSSAGQTYLVIRVAWSSDARITKPERQHSVIGSCAPDAEIAQLGAFCVEKCIIVLASMARCANQ